MSSIKENWSKWPRQAIFTTGFVTVLDYFGNHLEAHREQGEQVPLIVTVDELFDV